MLGCAAKAAAISAVCIVVIGLIVRHSDRSTRAIVAFAVSGLLLGLTTSFLVVPDPRLRRALWIAFVYVPIGLAAVMFVLRTLFGLSDRYPLMLAAAPTALAAGYLIGGIWRRR